MESDSHRHSNQPILIFLLTIQKKIISILSILLRPFLKISTFIKSNILKKYRSEKENGKVSEEYIKSLICKSEEEGVIQTYEKDMIESIFKFNDTRSKDIMTSRKDTFSINIDDDVEENIDKLLHSNYSRIPVYKDNIDNIIGIVHVRDILIHAKDIGFENINLEEIMHKPYFVPTSKKTNELFKILQGNKIHMAILIDEYGGFCGIVTMEDLVEEIVGDIEDEYDKENNNIVKINESIFIVDCSIELDEFNEAFNLELEEGEYNTLNGYIITQLGEIPKANEKVVINVDNINIEVVKVSNKKIEKVRVSYIN
ncbi:hemolysin family protein [Romboutsia ilealis]|uniref:hemolysin family protein n=1 Tax=Romboutsia ilealis TaxID=1115758 RepID=UPI00272BA7C1|nr:hemolysin family protein [Romboutsia ilealis]